ncbi:MAG TPA: bifunctional UDP-N-acetylglucosamine diphosphorylase/glucosamine-1-phosphate N-acetyltransferase GlmU [Candidatus Limnocylindria bacterium]|nr:bifunctional UDP-N-acetylglucosamine diphosphorylase/glucosamine-1-phosphate N-acetyltransferase GlmU [Candidatus Limnocylindria bacterium]
MTPPPSQTRAVILAAGLGTRMKSRLPKVLHPICGRPMLAYVIDAAREATGQRPLVVYSPVTAQICEAFASEADFALQDEPRGTGDALRAALQALPDEVDEVVVLSGDTPLIDAETVNETLERRRATSAVMALAPMFAEDPTGYGRLVVSDGWAERIVEEKDATDEEREIQLVNAGLYAFETAWLREAVSRLTPSAASGELYLTQLVELARTDDRPAAVTSPDEPYGDWLLGGVNDRAELQAAAFYIQQDILEDLLLEGVTIQDPSTTLVDATVEIAQDVTIEPNVILRGRTRIGRDTVIRAGSQIVDSVVGERCTIWASVVEGSVVGDDVRIGPFSHIRPGCEIAEGAEIGNFAEMKKVRFGARSKQHHFSYLGDADVGDDVNIGAGTITANYDGRKKHRTVIGDGAFIGSDTILRAPLNVGRKAVTGAGSVVTRDVPDGMLAVGVPARIRQRRKPEEPHAEAVDPAALREGGAG